LVFEKNANFFAENWQKSQKIVIITTTPGHPDGNRRFAAAATFPRDDVTDALDRILDVAVALARKAHQGSIL
jgi:hypothetical protein